MNSYITIMGTQVSFATLGIIAIIGVIFIFLMTSNKMKTARWNFFNVTYKHIEVEHDGIVREDYYIKDSDIKNGIFKDGNRTFLLHEIFHPIHERSNVIRYTFRNDNALPYLTSDGEVPTIKGINNYEVLTMTKDKKAFRIDSIFIKNILEEHFVEKIKRELQTGWEKLIEWLSTPSGFFVLIIVLVLIGFMVYTNGKH